jgi:DNA-binding IclR family transcriptional regulator
MHKPLSTATPMENERTQKSDRQDGIRVLNRAAEMLRLLRLNPGGLAQADMAAQLGLARTTVHRIMNALAAQHLVQLSGATGRYRLGSEILYMAEAARAALISEALPALRELSEAVQETVDLSVLDRNQVTFVEQVVSAQRLRAVSAIGSSFPLHCTANGKAILANLSRREVKRMLPEQLEPLTAKTITSRAALVVQLETVAKEGFAFDLEEHSPGICAIGAYVRDLPIGPAAVSVPIPSQRFAEKRSEVIAAIQRTVKAIETIFHQ